MASVFRIDVGYTMNLDIRADSEDEDGFEEDD